MDNYPKDYNLLSLSPETRECIVKDFTGLDEVSANFVYMDILKAVKEVISDDKIGILINLSIILKEITKTIKDEVLKKYQLIDKIGHFNLVSLACKNKAIKVLEYLFSDESQTLYNLSFKIAGLHNNESLLSVKDEFCHNAFYYAIRSNMTDILSLLIDKCQSRYSNEVLDDLLSENYKELKLRNVSLTRETQLFVQSKILDLRFFDESTAKNSGTGNSWEQIKKRIELVVKNIQIVKNDYWDQDPDEKFLFHAEFIAKNIHILKSLLKSTYDRIPWEEIEFCLTIFIKCCKHPSESNFVYNCVMNKKQLLKHLYNFSIFLDSQHNKFKNSNVIKLAKSVNLPRETVTDKITETNVNFRELYEDYEKIRDFFSLKIIKSYADLIETSDAPNKRRYLLVSRVLQVMGEHLKNTLDSPKLSKKTESVLLSSMSQNTREIITKLRDSLSHEETLFIRSEMEKKAYLFKNIQKDILKINAWIPDVLYTMKTAAVKILMKKIKLCESIEDVKDCYGPYRQSIDLYSKEIANTNEIKGDFERLEELILCLDQNIDDQNVVEKMLIQQIHSVIQKEKQRFENLKHAINSSGSAVSTLKFYVSSGNSFCHGIRRVANNIEDFTFEAPSKKFELIEKPLNELLKRIFSRNLQPENEELKHILFKCFVFFGVEMGSVKWIEDFRSFMIQNDAKKTQNKKHNHTLSENLLESKMTDLREVLIDFDLGNSITREEFSSFESNLELRAVTEMLVLDILSILEKSCSRNPFYLDSDFPILSGRNLRNHLAHGNALADVCLEESSSQLLVNAKKILTAVLPRNNKKIDSVIKCDYIKLKRSFDSDLTIIGNQRKFFFSLGEGNMKEVDDCLKEGSDVYGRDCNSWTCLHFAAKAPDCAVLKWLLKQGMDINSKTKTVENLLHIAARFNSLEVTRHLVEEERMCLTVRDINQKTPLHVAVENKSNDVVEYISKYQICTILKDNYCSTPLHTAIYKHNNEAASILLKKEANVDGIKGHSHFTSLHIATLSENPTLVELLIANKADVSSKSDFGDTPLHLATLTTHLGLVQALVLNGADVNAQNEAGDTPLINATEVGSMAIVDFLLLHGAHVNISSCDKSTPLMRACRYGHISIAELLLQNGAFIDLKDYAGSNALHFATMSGHYKIVELLLSLKTDSKHIDKETALLLSSNLGHKEILKLLLEKGAYINAVQKTNSTALLLATGRGYKDIVDILIDEGADIHHKNEIGATALHIAAYNEYRSIVQTLLKNGADIRENDENDMTPLDFLIEKGLSDLLTADGMDVNTSDVNGYTLLHLAAMYGNQMLVEHCIEKECDINARNINGLTALHLAAQENHKDIISLLLNNGAEFEKDYNGITPLILAARYNCKEAVETLISNEKNDYKLSNEDKIIALRGSVAFGYCDCVDVLLQNFKFDISNQLKQLLLVAAISANHKHVVSTLTERGFEINGDAKPLHVAVQYKHYDIAELLLIKGANQNLLDEDNSTPLEISVALGDVDMFEILLSENADDGIERKFIMSATKSAISKNQIDMIKLLLQKKLINVNDRDSNDSTLLHTSALYGSLDITRYLVAEGADVNSKDTKNRTPVDIGAEEGFLDIVEFYLNRNDLGDELVNLFSRATVHGKSHVCKLLLERSLDVYKILSSAPVHVAVLTDFKDVLLVMLHYGIYYNSPQLSQLKPTGENRAALLLRKIKNLFVAVQNNSASKVETFLKEDSDSDYCIANAKCVKNETVLHYAAWKGYEEVVNILLKYDTNPNVRSKTGNTPLHYAVKYSHFSIVKALLSNGAVFNAISQTGKTPLDYSTDQDIRDFLLSVENIFTKVLHNNPSVLDDVDLVRKDKVDMRSVIRTKNQAGKTLIELAHINDFSFIEELKNLFEADIADELKLAEKLYLGKNFDEAFLAFENILKKTVEKFGIDGYSILDVKMQLMKITYEQGKLDKALHLCREVHESRKKILGEDHPKSLLDEAYVYNILLIQNKTHEALQNVEAIRMKLKQKLKPDDFDMVEFEMFFGEALFVNNKFDEVLKINNGIQQMCAQKKEDNYRIMSADSMYATALILQKQNRLSESLKLYEKVYNLRKDIFTPRHTDTLKALTKVAEVLTLQGRSDESLKTLEEVLSIQKSFLPVNHHDIFVVEKAIGEVLICQGRLLSALKIFLSLDSRISAVAQNSLLMILVKEHISSLKYTFSVCGYECVFDRIQKSLDGNHE